MKVSGLLDRPEKWTQGWSARQADGTECNSTMDGAVCWCLYGAIKECYCDVALIVARVEETLGDFVTAWNDAPQRTYEDVIQLVTELDI